MAKSDYMMSILWILQTRQRTTARELAEELEISVRSVYRYIDSLCASGVPIIADSGHHGGYRLMEHFQSAPLLFDPDEQKSLVQAAQIAQDAGYPFPDHLNRAISKLKTYIGPNQLQHVQLHENRIGVITPSSKKFEDDLQLLSKCAAEGLTISMTYAKRSLTAAAERLLDPYGLVQWKGSWYAVGYCHQRREIRSFRVDRIQAMSITKLNFAPPESFSASQFFMSSLLPGSEEESALIDVRISGQEGALNELSRHWLFSHTLVSSENGEILFRLTEESIQTFAPYFLLSYGRAIRILEPASLQQRMVEVLTDMLEHYEQPGHD
ncbi:YafY family transcriptional regulator [Paenibacillus zeisoli]|uniref:YafY family transcriptional regulator n=1 Tax=Paenibacillus zeisoli TaxID=2496267 RepID=A0A3S1BBD5_9BACL|nr:YafY family protein [Paenibacillus zeisoli]RUT36486.1 YafY family transcriptional regulator [Paenibacillus zeisoli]